MVNGLIAHKLGMTQVYSDAGRLVPVTVLEVGPCKVVQVKTAERDGYVGAQLSFDEIKEHRMTKPARGHYKKAGVQPARVLREFGGDLSELSVGQTISAEIFEKGDYVDVTGLSKGKGFQGVMRRHNYRGGPRTHGSMFHRSTGAVGQCSSPSRVWKNKGMPGQMGNKRVTTQGLEVIEVRAGENLVFIKGSVPGGNKGVVMIRKSVKGKVKKEPDQKGGKKK
ncbi:MAG: 50S ribosomal protein L3 [Nitrospiria bacterium]